MRPVGPPGPRRQRWGIVSVAQHVAHGPVHPHREPLAGYQQRGQDGAGRQHPQVSGHGILPAIAATPGAATPRIITTLRAAIHRSAGIAPPTSITPPSWNRPRSAKSATALTRTSGTEARRNRPKPNLLASAASSTALASRYERTVPRNQRYAMA